jgi:hypothetical protein
MPMNKLKLEETVPKNLTAVVNPNDLRKDLHVFACYCRNYEIKRAHRDNSLPKVHLTRLTKMMSNPKLIQEVREDGNAPWINFIDRLNLKNYSSTWSMPKKFLLTSNILTVPLSPLRILYKVSLAIKSALKNQVPEKKDGSHSSVPSI